MATWGLWIRKFKMIPILSKPMHCYSECQKDFCGSWEVNSKRSMKSQAAKLGE